MTRENAYVKLDQIFQEVFDDKDIHVNDETTAADIEDWDSLTHIGLMVTIEECFRIKFNMGEVNGLKNVGEMMDAILSKLS